MRLSTRCRYALEGLLYLEVHGGGAPLSAKAVAEGTGISLPYLEQIFFLLKKAGLTTTVRGAKGGFIPALPAEEVTAGAVIRAIEGELTPVKCVDDPSLCPLAQSGACITRPLWAAVSQSVRETADSITLKELRDGFLREQGGMV